MAKDPRDNRNATTVATAVQRPTAAAPADDVDAGLSAATGPDAGTGSLEIRVWHAGNTALEPGTVDGVPPTAGEKAGADGEAPPARYQLRDLLGEGGMGSVKLYHDALVGRDVALKVMAARARGRPSYQRRFVREARIQGQLEHPAVVPVYDVGTTAEGAPYFTMKRLGGHTLGAVLEGLRHRDQSLTARFGQRRLLSDFVSACRAVAFAHSRGVIHRDLKPANVMLGDFGEVYVLDWGIAKVMAEPDEPEVGDVADAATWHQVRGDTPLLVDAPPTAAGVILGTPGYMAPEQIDGSPSLDGRADVYALGAILFEILTLEPLHTTVRSALSAREDDRPKRLERLRASASPVAPELETICLRATEVAPETRYPSVEAMVDDLERFLDGDRDLERRRELAELYASRAQEAADRLSFTGDLSPDARRAALREAGRALSLDPEHHGALRTMMRLLLSPPVEEPPEVRAALEEADVRQAAGQARQATWVFLSWLLVVPFGLLLGVRSIGLLALVGLSIVVQAALSAAVARSPRRRTDLLTAGVVTNALGLVAASRIISPMVLVPALAVGTTLMFLLNPSNRRPRLTIGLGVGVLFASYGLEWLGWPARTLEFEGGGVAISPGFTNPEPWLEMVSLLLATGFLLLFSGMVLLRMRARLREASVKVHLQTWQLQQIVPDPAQPLGSEETRRRLIVSD